jgi:hypothetical protein
MVRCWKFQRLSGDLCLLGLLRRLEHGQKVKIESFRIVWVSSAVRKSKRMASTCRRLARLGRIEGKLGRMGYDWAGIVGKVLEYHLSLSDIHFELL